MHICHIFTESHIYDCFRRYIASITTRRSSTQKTCFQGICSASNSLNRKTEHNGTMLPEYWFCFYHMRRQTFSPVNPMTRKVSTIFFAVFVAKHLQITTKKHAHTMRRSWSVSGNLDKQVWNKMRALWRQQHVYQNEDNRCGNHPGRMFLKWTCKGCLKQVSVLKWDCRQSPRQVWLGYPQFHLQ